MDLKFEKEPSGEELEALASPLTPQEEETINKLFTPYIFYRTLKNNGKECYCSSCRSHFFKKSERTMKDEDYAFLSAKHGETVQCPECGRTAELKNIGTIKKGKNLEEERRAVMIQVIDHDTVLLKCYYAWKSYETFYPENENVRFLKMPGIHMGKVYLLSPGDVKIAKHIYYFTSHFSRVERIGEPFTSYFSPASDYEVFGAGYLIGTFLKYLPIKEYNTHYCTHQVTLMCMYCLYPSLEVLLKTGNLAPVKELVFCGRPHKRELDWKKNTPWEIFKLPKAEYKILHEYTSSSATNYSFDALKIYNSLKKHNVKGGMKTAVHLSSLISSPEKRAVVIKYAAEGRFTLKRFENYINKNKGKGTFYNAISLWLDYEGWTTELEYDLDDPVVLLPKNLKKAHDEAFENHKAHIEEIEAKRAKELEAAAEKRIKKCKKKYEYSDGEFSIYVPSTSSEIIAEGKEQHHCVGGYAARHLRGKLCICFLRKTAKLEKSFYTIEMKKEKCMQIHGFRNCGIEESPKAQLFFEKWLKWVAAGSPAIKDAGRDAGTSAA